MVKSVKFKKFNYSFKFFVYMVIDIDRGVVLMMMEAFSGQTGITVSCIQHIIQVYLKKKHN